MKKEIDEAKQQKESQSKEHKDFFEKKLNNPGFMAKAPAALVEQQKAGLAKALDKIENILSGIKDLESM